MGDRGWLDAITAFPPFPSPMTYPLAPYFHVTFEEILHRLV